MLSEWARRCSSLMRHESHNRRLAQTKNKRAQQEVSSPSVLGIGRLNGGVAVGDPARFPRKRFERTCSMEGTQTARRLEDAATLTLAAAGSTVCRCFRSRQRWARRGVVSRAIALCLPLVARLRGFVSRSIASYHTSYLSSSSRSPSVMLTHASARDKSERRPPLLVLA